MVEKVALCEQKSFLGMAVEMEVVLQYTKSGGQ